MGLVLTKARPVRSFRPAPLGSVFIYFARESSGDGGWTYQGITYNVSSGLDRITHLPSPIGFAEQATITLTLPNEPFTGDVSGPATLTGQFSAFGDSFTYTGSGIGTVHVTNIPPLGVFQVGSATATFGQSAVVTPEPATWLLLVSGLLGLMLWQRRQHIVTVQ